MRCIPHFSTLSLVLSFALCLDRCLLQGGTSNGGFWQSTHEEDFSRTPLGVNEYRMEVFHPPYEFRLNRPRITTRLPTFVTYGSTFELGYAFDDGADVAGVVLVNAGGVSGCDTAWNCSCGGRDDSYSGLPQVFAAIECTAVPLALMTVAQRQHL